MSSTTCLYLFFKLTFRGWSVCDFEEVVFLIVIVVAIHETAFAINDDKKLLFPVARVGNAEI